MRVNRFSNYTANPHGQMMLETGVMTFFVIRSLLEAEPWMFSFPGLCYFALTWFLLFLVVRICSRSVFGS